MRRIITATTATADFRRTAAASIPHRFTPPPTTNIFHRRRSISTIPNSKTLAQQHSSYSGVAEHGIDSIESRKVLLKGMRYGEFENWITSQGYRPAQALMLWKLIYGNNSKNIWAHSCEELEGLNKDLMMMLSKSAKLKALQVKDIIKASDGTRKEAADFVYVR